MPHKPHHLSHENFQKCLPTNFKASIHLHMAEEHILGLELELELSLLPHIIKHIELILIQ